MAGESETPPIDKPADEKPADQQQTTDQTLIGDKKPEDKGEQKPAIPEKYELKLADGSTVDTTLLERTATTARELGLSNEQAQKLLSLQETEITKASDTARTALLDSFKPGGTEYEKKQKEWKAASLADTDIGGTEEKLLENVTAAKKVLTTFFPESVFKVLNDTGLGSNPDIIKGLAKISKSMGEGSLVGGKKPVPENGGERSAADILYGGSEKK